jgi:hypothetical protein
VRRRRCCLVSITVAVLAGLTAQARAAPGVAPEGRIVVSQLVLYDNPDGCTKSPCGWHRIWQGTVAAPFARLVDLGRGESYGDHFPPVLSPDGQWLAYPTRLGRVAIVQVELASGKAVAPPRFLARPAVAPTSVAWSPDGSQLALLQGFVNHGLWVVARDGTGPRRLVSGRRIDVFTGPGVSWAAPGIAFARQWRGRSAIYVIQPDGRGLRRLSRPRRATDDAQPAWSPDGGTVAFVRGGEAPLFGGAIQLVSGAGGAPQRIGRTGIAPAFSPSGRYITYVRPGEGYKSARLNVFDTMTRRATSSRLPGGLGSFGAPDGLTWLR